MLVALLLGNVFHSVLNVGGTYIAWVVTLLISAYETTSITENFVVIYPDVPFLKRISNLINKAADKQLEKAEELLSEKPKDDEKPDDTKDAKTDDKKVSE